MLKSVLIELDAVGATYERFEVPGSFELPGAIRLQLNPRKPFPVVRNSMVT